MIFLTLLETFAPLSTVRPRERLIGGYSTIQNKVRSGIIVKHALKTEERKRKEKEETTVLPYKTFYPSPKHFTITRERIAGSVHCWKRVSGIRELQLPSLPTEPHFPRDSFPSGQLIDFLHRNANKSLYATKYKIQSTFLLFPFPPFLSLYIDQIKKSLKERITSLLLSYSFALRGKKSYNLIKRKKEINK